MTLYLTLPPGIEAKLRAFAAATGKDMATVIFEAVEEKIAASAAADQSRLTPAEWSAELHAWAASHKPVKCRVDDSR